MSNRRRVSREPARQVSEGRRALYRFGQILMGLGLTMFLGFMLLVASSFGDHSFDSPSPAIPVFGMILMIGGGFAMGVGRAGVAGSGLMLDPERARADLEPFSRQAGGMLRDVLDESGLVAGGPREVVRVRCTKCRALNAEHARFCDQCGAALVES